MQTQKKLETVTCRDNVGRPELTLGGQYKIQASNAEQALVWLVGFEEPFSWSRFAELTW